LSCQLSVSAVSAENVLIGQKSAEINSAKPDISRIFYQKLAAKNAAKI